MKTYCKIAVAAFALTVSAILGSCKPGEMSASALAGIEKVTTAIESAGYRFVPRTANPLGYPSINLDPVYFLKMSNDTLDVYLPYFGRSYVAPMNPNQLGFNFTSTDFDYVVEAKKDGWEISIKPNDLENRRILFYLSVGNTGYATLSVLDTDRQSISFYGNIEI